MEVELARVFHPPAGIIVRLLFLSVNSFGVTILFYPFVAKEREEQPSSTFPEWLAIRVFI